MRVYLDNCAPIVTLTTNDRPDAVEAEANCVMRSISAVGRWNSPGNITGFRECRNPFEERRDHVSAGGISGD